MSVVLGYKFDSEFYADTTEGQQSLLEAINDAVTTDAYTDAALGDDLSREAAIAATWENTIVEGSPWGGYTFWQNCEIMNRDSKYPLNIERVTDESPAEMVAECKESLDME